MKNEVTPDNLTRASQGRLDSRHVLKKMGHDCHFSGLPSNCSARVTRTLPRRLGAVHWHHDLYQSLSTLAIPFGRVRSFRVSIHVLTLLLVLWVVLETYWLGGSSSFSAMIPMMIGVAAFVGVSAIRETIKWLCVRFIVIEGEPDTIRLWPLGAFSTHRIARPSSKLGWVCTLMGPLATLTIALLTGLVLYSVQGWTFLHSLDVFAPGESLAQWSATLNRASAITSAQYWILISFWWTFQASLTITLAHLLLLMPPFDGADLINLAWLTVDRRLANRYAAVRSDKAAANVDPAAIASYKPSISRFSAVTRLTVGLLSAAVLIIEAYPVGCIPALFVAIIGGMGSSHEWRSASFIAASAQLTPTDSRRYNSIPPIAHQPALEQLKAVQPDVDLDADAAADTGSFIQQQQQQKQKPSISSWHESSDPLVDGQTHSHPETSAGLSHQDHASLGVPSNIHAHAEDSVDLPPPADDVIDRILEHISRDGIEALSEEERKMLEAATTQRRRG